MRSTTQPTFQPTYVNPVYSRACPDPFVLKYLNEYWLYCTGLWTDGRCFGVLRSRDLVAWREVGGAMKPLDKEELEGIEATCYWAPEVWYENGVFLMYYSVGDEKRMQIRVARSDHPAGPFVDCGIRLTSEEFAIDAHIFRDEDGSRWMFYATDFLEHTRIGTGTVRDRMLDALTLDGQPSPVTRALFDWQVYDPRRIEKGGVRWHTVEGPFVLKRKGRYYQMFSGGNWQNETYGASYAMSDAISNPNEWRQVADGEITQPILRTIPGRVIGPGHNSVVRGPDNQQLFCVYHCWRRWTNQEASRALAIDRLDWVNERMLVIGPSMTPQPSPTAPTFVDYFDSREDELGDGFKQRPGTNKVKGLGTGWKLNGGEWTRVCGIARQERRSGRAEARCEFRAPYFVAEVSLRMQDELVEEGEAGIEISGEEGPALHFSFHPHSRQAVLKAQIGGPWVRQALPLPPAFDFAAFHLLRVEVNGRLVAVSVDPTFGGASLKWTGILNSQALSIALKTRETSAEFAGFAITHGWEDLFTDDVKAPTDYNWRTTMNDSRWRLNDQQLWFLGPRGEASILSKGPTPEEYELVVNAKMICEPNPGECYGFLPAIGPDNNAGPLTVEMHGSGWAICCETSAGKETFPLSAGFNPMEYQQFRFRRRGGRLTIQHEDQLIGEIESKGPAGAIGLYCNRVIVAFDMVRVTDLSGGGNPREQENDQPRT